MSSLLSITIVRVLEGAWAKYIRTSRTPQKERQLAVILKMFRMVSSANPTGVAIGSFSS